MKIIKGYKTSSKFKKKVKIVDRTDSLNELSSLKKQCYFLITIFQTVEHFALVYKFRGTAVCFFNNFTINRRSYPPAP